MNNDNDNSRDKQPDEKGIYTVIGEDCNIKDDDIVNVTELEDGYMIKYIAKRQNNLHRFEKRNKYEYIDTTTGEIKRYNMSTSEYKSRADVLRAMRKLKNIIIYNFTGASNELWITITNKGDITDIDTMNKQFEKFWDVMKKELPGLENVYKIENDEGFLHLHLLLKDLKNKRLYISNKRISELFGGIFTFTRRTRNNNNESIVKLANYMGKPEGLEDFPKGKKLYYRSRGIRTPKPEKMDYKTVKKKWEMTTI